MPIAVNKATGARNIHSIDPILPGILIKSNCIPRFAKRKLCLKGGSSLHCPFCGHPDSKVIDSRASDEMNAIRRRRECLICQKRFTTYERIEETPLMVIKKDGRREPFDRQKVINGLLKACEKRPVAYAVLERLADTVERELRNRMDQEIKSAVIGEVVMEGLKEIDDVAYVRFASVYRQFKDLAIFMEELQGLLGQRKKNTEES
jgi:transcriptional repressor NrdR